MHEKGGERFKVATADGNHIDAMFFDRRGRSGKGRFGFRVDSLIIIQGDASGCSQGFVDIKIEVAF